MDAHWLRMWSLVVVVSALSGWWLAVRPGATYRGASGPVSILIVVMAVLLSLLALRG